MLFSVDPSNVFGKTVDESGTYNVKVLPSTTTKKSSTGKDMVTLDYEVLDGKYAGGKIRFDNVVWDDSTTDKYYNSITRFNTILVAAKVPAGTQIADFGSFARGIVGKQLAVRTEWEQSNNGKYYLTIKGYQPTLSEGSKPDGHLRPTSNSSAGGFSQNNTHQPQGNYQQGNNPQGQSAPFNQGNGAPDQVTDDDLPF